MARAVAGLLLILTGAALADQPKNETERVRRFADSLFAQGDYFRAATEYLRLLSYEPGEPGEPGQPDVEEIGFTIAMCSHRSGRRAEAAKAFMRLSVLASSTEMRDRCRFQAAADSYAEEAFGDAHAICAGAAPAPGSLHHDPLTYLDGLSLMHLEKWNDARAAFGQVSGSSALAKSAADLGVLASRGAGLPRRSPWVTGALSAVLPGLGQIACGYHWDGLSALVLTGASLAVTMAGYRGGNEGLKATGLSLLGIWYTASIYGGANAAGRRNRQEVSRLIAGADSRSDLPLER
jgi:hypothetical protein